MPGGRQIRLSQSCKETRPYDGLRTHPNKEPWSHTSGVHDHSSCLERARTPTCSARRRQHALDWATESTGLAGHTRQTVPPDRLVGGMIPFTGACYRQPEPRLEIALCHGLHCRLAALLPDRRGRAAERFPLERKPPNPGAHSTGHLSTPSLPSGNRAIRDRAIGEQVYLPRAFGANAARRRIG